MKPPKRFQGWRLAVAISAVGLLLSPLAHAGKLYKWTDAQGNVTYQDQPPPGDAIILQDDASDSEGKSDVGDLEQAIADNPVTLYSVPICDTCDLIRMVLERNAVPFQEKNADQDEDVQKELQEKTGQLTVPVVLIGDTVLTGYSGPEVRRALTDAGYPLPETAARARTPEATPDEGQDASLEPDEGQDASLEPEPGEEQDTLLEQEAALEEPVFEEPVLEDSAEPATSDTATSSAY